MVDTVDVLSNPFVTVKSLGVTKGVSINNLPEEAFRVLVGRGGSTKDRALYQKVWALYRAVDIRRGGVRSIPFEIRDRSGKVVDTSDNYQNTVKFFPKPRRFLGRAEAALTIWGRAYFEKVRNEFGIAKYLYYLVPSSVTPRYVEDPDSEGFGNLAVFERAVNKGRPVAISPEDMLYIWREDPYEDEGHPAEESPFMAAAAAAGVLLNTDQFAALFFERGAIKGTILALDGNPPEAEKERIKSLWGRLMKGVKNAWSEMVINAKSLTPVVVGEGLESLARRDLTEDKARAIATAMGIPYSILFSDAANHAVSEEDNRHFYDKTILPECELIEDAVNEQFFAGTGYSFHFTPEGMDLYQEDEVQRAQSLTQFMEFVKMCLETFPDAKGALAVANDFGYDLTDETKKAIERAFTEKEARRVEMQQQTQPNPANTPPEKEQDDQPEPGMMGEDEDDETRKELGAWMRKQIKHTKAGKTGAVEFTCFKIRPSLSGAIVGQLETVKTVDDVRRIFSNALAWQGYP